MYHSILVPLDGSTFGEHALVFALSIARRAEVPLHLVHAHVPVALMYAENAFNMEGTLDPKIREQEKAYLDGAAKRVAATINHRTRALIGYSRSSRRIW